eukprot:TRINITY_DN11500_c0_g1_i1.p2 TRINITY_DN11500_c0_g1~~TRINITY_DN11500_c0_g1_i1.p2  ORF type:complete len:295 (+),score=85.56 TRINITY_DN11500_c0_g1_i1:217-1101(+)
MDSSYAGRNVVQKPVELQSLKVDRAPSPAANDPITCTVRITKSDSFGIVVAANPNGRGLFIAKITPDTPAAACTQLRQGQRLLAVDGHNAMKWTRKMFGKHVAQVNTIVLELALDLTTFAALDGGVALRNAILGHLATHAHVLAPPELAPTGVVHSQAVVQHVTVDCFGDTKLAKLEAPIQEALSEGGKLRWGSKLQVHASQLKVVAKDQALSAVHLLDVINVMATDKYLLLVEKQLKERTQLRAQTCFQCHVYRFKSTSAAATMLSYLRVQLAEVFEMVRTRATTALTQDTEA